jgi:hypothetical protein
MSKAVLHKMLTILADLFFAWVLLHFGMGGWGGLSVLLDDFGLMPWLLLVGVMFLLFFRSDYRTDIPLFISGLALGYWGEWWGTTREVWTYWNDATPPDYLPPLWGIGLLTVNRLSSFVEPLFDRDLPKWSRWGMATSFFVLPLVTLMASWDRLSFVDWSGRLDLHFFAGLLVAVVLIGHCFNLRRAFPLFLSGTLLGGVYEYLGTSSGEWVYITGEVPPLWIAPLWGLASVAMSQLASLGCNLFESIWMRTRSGQRVSGRPTFSE